MTVFRTRSGAVRGRRTARDPGVVVLRGIPYAAPPFGADRFGAPRPAAAWDGIRDGAAFGPVAPQSAQLPGAPSWSPGDEDVLSLNIWTPGTGGDGLPVLVWIHGGAFVLGSSAQPDFDGTALAGEGLVVVTLNYRLGFEGFGHVPPGADGDSCPDNRGLLDQIAALEWVRANIAAFGGAAGNVTVAGQSAGATAVACLMAMDRARGLFRRAIAHSAVNACATPESAARITREVAAAAGVPATYDGLVSATPGALVDASDAVADRYRGDPVSGQRHYDPAIYGPIAGGDTLPLDPLTAAAGLGAADVDLLVCHTTEEYWLLDAVGSSAKITTEEQLAVFAADFELTPNCWTPTGSSCPAARSSTCSSPCTGTCCSASTAADSPNPTPAQAAVLSCPGSPAGVTVRGAGPGLALRGHPVRLRQPRRGERPLPCRRAAGCRRPRPLEAHDARLGRLRRHRRPRLAGCRRLHGRGEDLGHGRRGRRRCARRVPGGVACRRTSAAHTLSVGGGQGVCDGSLSGVGAVLITAVAVWPL